MTKLLEEVQGGLEKIINSENFKSDGKNIYYYHADIGVWRKYERLKFNQKIWQLMKQKGGASVYKRLYQELLEDPKFFHDFNKNQNMNWVTVANGRLNLHTFELKKPQKEDYETKFLNFEFNKDAKWEDAPVFLDYIDKSLGVDFSVKGKALERHIKGILLCQILTYLVTNLFGAKKMIVLLGEPHSGKSVLLKLLRRIIGSNYSAPLALSDLIDRFRSSLLEDVSLVINDEMICSGVRNLARLKQVVSGEEIIIEKKGQQPSVFLPRVKLVYAANQLPLLSEYDSSNAFAERLCILCFKGSVKRELWDLDLPEKLFQERNVIMSMAFKESRNFIQNLIFTRVQESEEILSAYKEENGSIESFLNDDSWCEKGEGKRVYTSDLYAAYVNFCRQNSLKAFMQPVFRQQISQLGFVRKKLRINQGRPLAGIEGIALKS